MTARPATYWRPRLKTTSYLFRKLKLYEQRVHFALTTVLSAHWNRDADQFKPVSGMDALTKPSVLVTQPLR